MARSVPAKAWGETREAYTTRLKKICDEINGTLDVAEVFWSELPSSSIGRGVVCQSESRDPEGIRWGSPWDPGPQMGIRVKSTPFVAGDPPDELCPYIILIRKKKFRRVLRNCSAACFQTGSQNSFTQLLCSLLPDRLPKQLGCKGGVLEFYRAVRQPMFPNKLGCKGPRR